MKNLITHRFFVAITLATAVVACWGNAQAQISIETIVGDLSHESIIRLLQNDDCIEHKHDGFSGTFNYVDFTNMSEKRTSIPANLNIQVSDFEIYNSNIVFFCGSMNTGATSGCIGWFRVLDLVNGTGNVSVTSFTDCTKFLKMDVFSTVANEVHIVATAEFNDPHYSYPIRGVYDAIFDIVNWAISGAKYNNYGGDIDYFEDIVCTDNYVATVEQKYTGNAEYTRVFAMPTTPGGDIFTTPPCNNYSFYGNIDFIPENRERLITRMSGDYYATACYVEYQTNYGLGISIYQATNSGPTLVDRMFVPLGSTFDPNWELQDFTYNHKYRKFYILHNTWTTPHVSDIIIIDNSGMFTTVSCKHAVNTHLSSLSNTMLSNTEMISGSEFTTSEPRFVRLGASPTTRCLPTYPLAISPVSITNGTAINGPDLANELPILYNFPINTTTYTIRNLCR